MLNSRSSSRNMRPLTTLIPTEYLEEHAKELGMVKRESKPPIPFLVWAFVPGFPQAKANHSLGSDAATTHSRRTDLTERPLPLNDANTRRVSPRPRQAWSRQSRGSHPCRHWN